MNTLILGSGGREDALRWAIMRDHPERKTFCAPGNAGSTRDATRVPLHLTDANAIIKFVKDASIDLVLIGPEAPLVDGLADVLRASGVACFGPGAAASQLEGSKIFAKEFMTRHDIPTAKYEVFDSFADAERFLNSEQAFFPCVVKADGLAAGKGVIMASNQREAIDAARNMLIDQQFGSAGSRILIEETLVGTEASYFVLFDGNTSVSLAPCQDYKRAHDGDEGLNTGGMGTYSPSVHLTEDWKTKIESQVVTPTIEGLKKDHLDYKGVIFIGLMLTDSGPKVLEYNVRFGDPETQVLMPRLKGDWADLLMACATGTLHEVRVQWTPEAAVCIILAAQGYPASYPKGDVIEGLDAAANLPGITLFHAGTETNEQGQVVTAGGRVLGVTATGKDVGEARERAYRAVNSIHWNGVHYRTDIAADAIAAQQEIGP